MIRQNALRVSMLVLSTIVLGACSKSSDGTVDSTAAAITAVDSTAPAAATVRQEVAAASSTASTITPVDINTASDADILKIPGVGKKMLREFKEYRPWTSVEQFRREIGKYVDKAEVARLEQYIVIK